MTRFAYLDCCTQHPSVARAGTAADAARREPHGFSSTRGLSTLLLSAIAAAVMVVAYQVMDTLAEGHMLAVWMVLWAVAFVVLAGFASSARTLSCSIVGGLNRWSAATAQARADQRLWAIACADSRIMSELQSAVSRSDNDFDDATVLAAKRAINASSASLQPPQRH